MSKLRRILSIDGGGIRGILPAQVLVSLERKLKEHSGNANARIADYFDLIAGTSTGGILALLLLVPDGDTGRPKYSAEEAAELYMRRGPEIFELPLYHCLRTAGGLSDEKYPATGLESTMEAYFRDLHLSDLLKTCMITAYDIRRRRAMFFTKHDAKAGEHRDFLVRDVARATTAAPTYFEAANVVSRSGVHYPCIDGGVFANNPTLCAYAEARTHFGVRAADMAILTLGTGDVAQPYHYETAKDWGAYGWMKPLIDIMMTGVAETVDYECKLAFDAVGVPEQYLRINVSLRNLPPGMSSDMDDASESNLDGLRELGLETSQQFNGQLEEFARLLVEA